MGQLEPLPTLGHWVGGRDVGRNAPRSGLQAHPSTVAIAVGLAQTALGPSLLGGSLEGGHLICSGILGSPSLLGLLLGLPEHVDLSQGR